MKLQALIFDVDGTLSETEETHREAFNQTFAANGMDWHWDQAMYAKLLLTTGGKERMAAYVRDVLGERPDVARIAELHKEKTRRYTQLVAEGGAPLRPGIRELIADAKSEGLRLAIATTTNIPNVDALVQANWNCKAADMFEVIAAGDMVKNKKPASDVYDLALMGLQLLPSECIAFEDTAHGVASASAAGIRVVAVPGMYSRDQDFTGAKAVRVQYTSFSLAEALRFFQS